VDLGGAALGAFGAAFGAAFGEVFGAAFRGDFWLGADFAGGDLGDGDFGGCLAGVPLTGFSAGDGTGFVPVEVPPLPAGTVGVVVTVPGVAVLDGEVVAPGVAAVVLDGAPGRAAGAAASGVVGVALIPVAMDCWLISSPTGA
jgi:hypothetical protein